MKISIIIPFYNSMPLMNDLIDSICNNMDEVDDYNNFEFIFVNDGSTDNYSCVLDPFFQKYTSAKLISIKNSGVGSARNKGIENAVGDYIWFVDSDDIIENHAFKNIMNGLKNLSSLPDLIFCDCKGYKDQSCEYYQFNYKYSNYIQGINHIIDKGDRGRIYDILFGKMKINYAIWYQLFRREFLTENRLFFNNKLKISEDMDYKFKTLSCAHSILGLDACVYIYRLPNSMRESLSKSTLSNEQTLLLSDMYIYWYNRFNKLADAVSGENDGYSLMKKKLSLLVYSSHKMLQKEENSQPIRDYLTRYEVQLKDIYQANKEYLDKVLEEIRNGNYSNI